MAYAANQTHLYFVNAADQCIYQLDLNAGNKPKAITSPGLRFADLVIDTVHQQLIAVGEQHHDDREPENFIAAINIATGAVSTLKSGADFYAYPRISPDNQQLCWIEWQHPNMPWDSTQLWCAQLTVDGLSDLALIAGGDNNQAIFQPSFSPDNQLHYVSDKITGGISTQPMANLC